jgi:hypothetical protein
VKRQKSRLLGLLISRVREGAAALLDAKLVMKYTMFFFFILSFFYLQSYSNSLAEKVLWN